MRFYLLRLTPPNTTVKKTIQVSFASSPGISTTGSYLASYATPGSKEWTSYPNGIYDPAAHNIIFDLPITAYSTPVGAQTVTIEGPALIDLVQAANYAPTGPTAKNPTNAFASWTIELYGGMSPEGLPLSTPAAGQPAPGLLATGEVFEAFGNWVGTDMSLSFLIVPGGNDKARPGLVFNWLPGQPIAQALGAMFSVAYPGRTQVIQVSPDLVGPVHGYPCIAKTLAGMAQAILDMTEGNKNGMPVGYPGVEIYIQGGTIYATDTTQTKNLKAVEISLDSIIGQPVWTGSGVIAINVQQRADIQVGGIIKLPTGKSYGGLPGMVTTSAIPGNYAFDLNLAFNGPFIVKSIRHLGDFRGTSGLDWMTVIEAIALSELI
ncbi:hypothetical protein [Acidithiobacillus sp.]|uniref:hypothetical protein n=1 Tax=Acidithiobacillus sp. TaxID=1872118 RepID=UPI003D07D358